MIPWPAEGEATQSNQARSTSAPTGVRNLEYRVRSGVWHSADGEPKANASTVEAATDRLRLNPDHANPFQEVFRTDRFVLAPEGELAGEDVAFPKLGEREPVGLARRPRKRLLVEGPGTQSPEILMTQVGRGGSEGYNPVEPPWPSQDGWIDGRRIVRGRHDDHTFVLSKAVKTV